MKSLKSAQSDTLGASFGFCNPEYQPWAQFPAGVQLVGCIFVFFAISAEEISFEIRPLLYRCTSVSIHDIATSSVVPGSLCQHPHIISFRDAWSIAGTQVEPLYQQ